MKSKLTSIRRTIRRIYKQHRTFVLVLAVLSVSLVMVVRIFILSNTGTDQDYLNENENKVKAVNFRQEAIKEIESLRDSNVNVPGVQLPSGRQNPFSE
jgi:maltodextrin utilization protein YvdJ